MLCLSLVVMRCQPLRRALVVIQWEKNVRNEDKVCNEESIQSERG
ncbi:acetyltransferase [Vibrio cholerae]|nr:acetyltransferase [Vibrio cholerae]KAA1205131.1 acetyltransferase [Vibrio cholerae]KAA1217033.1 acetyltransferase [Vibrio cholerae]TYW31158.1 acetyltransferase [Vibrio cholerae]